MAALGHGLTSAAHAMPYDEGTQMRDGFTIARKTVAAALLVIASWTWTLPLPAVAQLLPPLPGSLVVTMTSPSSGSTVAGTITVSANASIVGSLTVSGVQFYLDGAPLGAEDAAAPYAVSWNTAAAGNGAHTLKAVARDLLGLRFTSNQVTVTVSDGPPPDTAPPSAAITSPTHGATVSGTISVTATASDNVGVAGVQFKLDGANLGVEDTSAPYAVNWDSTATSNGSHTLTAVARDAAGNAGTSAPVTVTVSNGGPPPDATPPTVAITSPADGTTVSGTITVSADATDNVRVTGVQFLLDGAILGTEDSTAPYAVTWDTTATADGAHTLAAVARDAAGNRGTSAQVRVTVSNRPAQTSPDVFVSIRDGHVQWRNPDGTLRTVLTSASDGPASGMAFDAAGNLYVTHFFGSTTPGNTVARFDPNSNLLGTFESGYNSNPESIVFDASGNAYVGQADDTKDILKFDAAGNLLASFDVATELRGSDWVELAGDGCTIYYTSRLQNVLRFDVCTNTQLPNFNTEPLPGEHAYALRLLPDGGLLVANASVVVRLNASGNLVQTYTVPGEPGYLWFGLDLVGDGTFWAANTYASTVYKFDLATGAVLANFNSGTPINTIDGLAVRRGVR